MDWTRYFCCAVVTLLIQPSEAWLLSPQEFWALWEYKTAKPSGAATTQTESDDMIASLKAQGKL